MILGIDLFFLISLFCPLILVIFIANPLVGQIYVAESCDVYLTGCAQVLVAEFNFAGYTSARRL
jgi:hypothetical protein